MSLAAFRTDGKRVRAGDGTVVFQAGRQLAAKGDVLPGATVATLSETSAYLTNPSIGYQGYTYETGIYPISVDYRRGNTVNQGNIDWADMNPAQGSYNWAPVEALLTAAAARGQRASFRVTTMIGDTYGGHNVPSWVLPLGVTILSDGQPDYDQYAYQYWFGVFVDAMAARYDGDPRIAFVDISGYGKFNEWQSYSKTSGNDEDPTQPVTSVDGTCRRHLIHCYVGGSGTLKSYLADGTTTRSDAYTHPGFQRTQLVMPYGGQWNPTRYVLANYPNVGFRNDALGSSDASAATLGQIGYGILTLSRTAPVMFEPIHDWNSATMAATAKATLAALGVSFIHDNGLANDAATTDMLLRVGYRYLCSKTRTKPSVTRGGILAVESTWTNTGYAKSYPRMGQDFAVSLALVDSGGTVQASWITEHAVSSWLPGQQQTVLDFVTVPGIFAGSYTLHVGITDRTTGNRIALPLTTGRGDNWYPTGALTVT